MPEPSPVPRAAARPGADDASNSEDLGWITAFLAGDHLAFQSLFEKYNERVYKLAFRFVRDKEDALEVTQEVFLRVHRGLARFKTDSRFFTWLYRITVNRAIDFTRRRKGQRALGLEAAAGDRALLARLKRAPGPQQLAQESELKERLQDAVKRLSEKHRAVFLLHATENLSYKEIASVVGCNIGTVMSRLFYARKRLKEILTGYGFDIENESRT